MYKLLALSLTLLACSCRTAKHASKEDAVTKVSNETIKSLIDSGVIRK